MSMNHTGKAAVGSPLPMVISLEIEQKGRKWKLLCRKSRVVIGSLESADVRLSGAEVSPIHAILELKEGKESSGREALLIDLAGGGTRVNGREIVSERVHPGDWLQIGNSVLRFSLEHRSPRHELPDQSLLLIDPESVTPIFDHRPDRKPVLEVAASWNGVILDVMHFAGDEEARVGSGLKAHFRVPGGRSGSGDSVLARNDGKSWIIHLKPGMAGVFYRNGRIKTVEDLAGPRGSVVEFGENDFLKIQIGTLILNLSQTAAPPGLLQKGEGVSDPLLGKLLLGSIALSLLFLFTVSRLPVVEEVPEPIDPHVVIIDPATLSQLAKAKPVLDVKDRKNDAEVTKKATSASVDFTKPREKESDRPKVKSSEPGKKIEERRNALAGEGVRAKGIEGARGSKLPFRESGNAAHRLSPSPGTGRGGTQTASEDQGPLQAIQGATSKFLDLLGGSPKLGKSGSRLEGFGDREGRGDSGSALEGSGRGGGGVADPLIGGAGSRNRGGAKVGVGPGAEGTGRGMVGGRVRIELNAGGSNESVVIGAIDRDAIEAAFRAHANEFRYCYEREINSGHPGLKGKVVAAFVIEASGRADSVSVASSSIASVNVENCVLGVISRIQFPKPGGGVPVTIKYPISFMNSSK